MEKEVTPQLYHSDEHHDDDIQSEYSNELSQLRNIDKNPNMISRRQLIGTEVDQSEPLVRQRYQVDIRMKTFFQ